MDNNEEFSYNVKSTHGAVKYIECKHKNVYPCPARGKIVDDKIILVQEHFHAQHSNENAVKHFKKELRATVSSTLEDLRIIYDRICLQYPLEGVMVPFRSVESSMMRWRRKFRPAIPDSLLDYANIINSDEWQHLRFYRGGNISITTVQIDDRNSATIIRDVEFLSLLRVEELYLDATFKVCPKKPKILQLLTIMTRVDNAVVPVAWALMMRKTTASYIAVLQFFARENEHIQPLHIMMDFEEAQKSAVSVVYPAATIYHCYFHFVQALIRQLGRKEDALCVALRTRDEVKIVMRKFMALPLLPADKINLAFNWIVDNATQEIRHLFHNLTNYLQHYWLERVTPQRFSVFGKAHRTNNAMEAYHRVMHHRMGSHPSIWKFTQFLVNLQSVTRMEWMSLSIGQPIRRPILKKYEDFDKFLFRAWELYNLNALDTRRFLACANHLIKAFRNKHLIHDVRQVDMFVDARDHDNSIHPIALQGDVNIVPDINSIKLLRPQPDHELSSILLLNNFQSSRCKICWERMTNYVSLPCSHWFGCKHCCIVCGKLAVREKAHLRCSECAEIIAAFRRINIT